MADSDDRIRLSREDIGILMSYATRPDHFSAEVIDKLRRGVDHSELEEVLARVGLPQSTAARLFEADRPSDRSGVTRSPLFTVRYRRNLLGILLVYLVSALVISVASGRGPWGVFVFSVGSVVAAYLVYTLILRLAPH